MVPRSRVQAPGGRIQRAGRANAGYDYEFCRANHRKSLFSLICISFQVDFDNATDKRNINLFVNVGSPRKLLCPERVRRHQACRGNELHW